MLRELVLSTLSWSVEGKAEQVGKVEAGWPSRASTRLRSETAAELLLKSVD